MSWKDVAFGIESISLIGVIILACFPSVISSRIILFLIVVASFVLLYTGVYIVVNAYIERNNVYEQHLQRLFDDNERLRSENEKLTKLKNTFPKKNTGEQKVFNVKIK